VVGSEKPPEGVKTEVMDSQVSVAPTRVFPVSIKGVVVQAGRVLLLHNERDEWELPGGKLELGEDPAACVAREIAEETGWPVTTGPILDAWQYHIRPGIDVLIVTYGCHTTATTPPVVSHEHSQVGLFAEDEVPALRMPEGYKRSIAAWFAHLREQDIA
jgi:8-oxo-dGTP pyrophosphatase MutT (NUDIX family)